MTLFEEDYEFVFGKLVTIRLKKDPYAGVVVSFTGDVNVLDETDPTGDGVTFDFTVVSMPEGYDETLLDQRVFTDLLAEIIMSWVVRHFEENGPSKAGVVSIHAPVDAADL